MARHVGGLRGSIWQRIWKQIVFPEPSIFFTSPISVECRPERCNRGNDAISCAKLLCWRIRLCLSPVAAYVSPPSAPKLKLASNTSPKYWKFTFDLTLQSHLGYLRHFQLNWCFCVLKPWSCPPLSRVIALNIHQS